MSLEDPSRPADKDDAWHDRSIHDPAWYCLPPFVTTGIYRQMVRRQEQYEEAIALPAGRKRDKAVELVSLESTLFADDLEVVNTLSVAELYMHTDRPYHDISMRLGAIIGERPEVVETAIQEHIRDPKPENILVASFI